MKILVVSQHYYPENFLITKICEGLVERGHEVTVVTGTPNYPQGKIYAGYEKGKKKEEILSGVKVHRCYEIARKKGIVYRLLNYYSFALSSKRYVKKLQQSFDVVFSYQLSPVMQANAAVYYRKKTGTPMALYCLDLWPESLSVGKIKEKSFAYRYYKGVSKKIYAAADKLLVSSRLFIQRMQKNFAIDGERFIYLPQHGEDVFSVESCKKEEDNYCDLLFAGNVGLAQNVETIVRAAAQLKDCQNIRFHIVGDGTSLEEVKELSHQLETTNVFFYGKRPMEEMPSYYAKADAMLLTFAKSDVLAMTVPLKTQSYMAAGKPILCAANGAVAEEIKNAACGYVSPAEDVDALKENILRFAMSQDKGQMGVNARAYFEENFTKDKFLGGLEKALREVSNKD